MDFILHKDFSSLEAEAWNALLSESITNVPFLRHEYLRNWWQTRGGGEWESPELVLVSASENGRLIGIAPLFVTRHDTSAAASTGSPYGDFAARRLDTGGARALMLVGSIEISDYLDLIVRAADLPRFLSGLLDFVLSSGPSAWSGLDWWNLPDSTPTLAVLQAEAGRRGWIYTQEIYRPTPTIIFNGSYEAYLAGLEKKQRHEMRRKVRRAEERGARWYLAGQGAELEAEIEAFLTLMEDDQNKANFLKPAMREQMRLCMRAAHENGWLWLAFLEIDGRKAAAALNFDYQNRLWGYNSGVDSSFLELSPGWVLLTYTLQWAAEHGRAEFDFMRGDEEYKYRFGAQNRHVMRARVNR